VQISKERFSIASVIVKRMTIFFTLCYVFNTVAVVILINVCRARKNFFFFLLCVEETYCTLVRDSISNANRMYIDGWIVFLLFSFATREKKCSCRVFSYINIVISRQHDGENRRKLAYFFLFFLL